MFFPLLNFFLCSLLGGKRINNFKGLVIQLFYIWGFINLLIIINFIFILNSNLILYLEFYLWFDIFPVTLDWSIYLNKVNCIMIILIMLISSFVHFYSISYMKYDPNLSRFLGYLSLFTFFMLVLVLAPNLIQLFIGWEGVGICSYLLINFWSTRLLAIQSAYKAMILNKIGDIFILISIGILIKELGTININLVNSIINFKINSNLILISLIFILIGCFTKSAQIGLHMWLPDAMEGPTPVSALIHAATMVTAGIFLIIKLSPFLFYYYTSQIIIMIIGSITCFMSAFIGSFQIDLKKVIAYSTCSQLGYMVMVCGYGYYNIAIFHLFNHGIFKALLFLSAGLLIHSLFNEQNLMKMGLENLVILGKKSFIYGNLAIVGFPFFTGFYSKDLFLELIASDNLLFFPIWLAYLAASLTCFYSLKIFITGYSKEKRFYLIYNNFFHQTDYYILTCLFSLSILTIILGFLSINSITYPLKPIIITNLLKIIPLLILVIILFLFFVTRKILFNKWIISKIFKFFSNNIYFNEILANLNHLISKSTFNVNYKLIDSQLLENLIIFNPTIKFKYVSSKLIDFNSDTFIIVLRNLFIGLFFCLIYQI